MMGCKSGNQLGWKWSIAETTVIFVSDVFFERRKETSDFAERSLPLLSHLWPDERGDDELWKVFALRDADELLRLVGATQEREDGRTRQVPYLLKRGFVKRSRQTSQPTSSCGAFKELFKAF